MQQAKECIKDTVRLYLKKDEFGDYRIPIVRQRPVFLIGAPGIGKTAIMEQIAQELSIALVSYSMTHHTRQSALGLPFIDHREYEGERYDVSEYTMSEIIASIYEVMEKSGLKEGILFLDEINCVSETLSPSMLQFLQYKVFGRHSVPEGWVIVTAGNPPEYNKSVREFDVVTMDRLKVMEVEADYTVWKEYAAEKGLHNAIISYLDLKKEDFYHVETTVKGKSYITARGWEDLSQILQLYEEEGLPVDETLVGQYLRNERIVKEFTAYYDLYNKYKNDYKIEEILSGEYSDRAVEKAKAAAFDERLSLLGMLLDKVQGEMRETMRFADCLKELRAPLKALSGCADKDKLTKMLKMQKEAREKLLQSLQAAGALSDADGYKNKFMIRFLTEAEREVRTGDVSDGAAAYALIREKFGSNTVSLKKQTEEIRRRLHCLFTFVETAFEAGNEMLVLVTELTVHDDSARFIAAFGCPDYQRHNEELMLSERQNKFMDEIEKLDLSR